MCLDGRGSSFNDIELNDSSIYSLHFYVFNIHDNYEKRKPVIWWKLMMNPTNILS